MGVSPMVAEHGFLMVLESCARTRVGQAPHRACPAGDAARPCHGLLLKGDDDRQIGGADLHQSM